MTNIATLITDEQTLVSVTNRFGYAIACYDDGFGSLWLYTESMGVRGIVRAKTFEEALECVYDDILPPIAQEDVEDAFDGDELLEGYQFQANSTGTGIVAIDLNGEYLEPLTQALLETYEITLVIEET